jgi:hypothetical protein
MVRPTSTRSDDGSLIVNLLSVARPVFAMASAVERGDYRKLFGWRTRARRVDWFVFLANFLSEPEVGQKYWSDLEFPGRRPTMRSTDPWPAAPNNGLGWSRLRGRRQGSKAEAVTRAVLEDLLRGSGWLEGVDEAVEDVLLALRAGK